MRWRLPTTLAVIGLAAAAVHAQAQAPLPPTVSPAATPAGQLVSFTVTLPLRNAAGLQQLLADQQTPGSPDYHRFLSPAAFNARFGPSADAVAQVASALSAQGLTVNAAQGRFLRVSGSAATVQRALSTRLSDVALQTGQQIVVAGVPVQLPPAVQAQGGVTAAFSGLPRLHHHSRTLPKLDPNNRYTAFGPYWFTDLKQAYDFPAYTSQVKGHNLDGTGVNVAVVMDHDALDSDIGLMFENEKFSKITGLKDPVIQRQTIDGGAPFDPVQSAESSLDVQQVLGGAPGASVTLVNVPDLTDDELLAAYQYVVNATNPTGAAYYQLVNSSFGGCEALYTAAYNGGSDYTYILSAYDDLFAQGNAEGITFVASSGDEGALACPDTNYFSASSAVSRFVPGVSFPASDPHVTAVGGTNLLTNASSGLDSTYAGENGMGDPEVPYDPYLVGKPVTAGYWGPGGGVSVVFSRPTYQALVNTGSTTRRTVPDVGMQVGGCPSGLAFQPCGPNRSAAVVVVGGAAEGVIGTSVAAPEFVGALALYAQANGPLGDVNPYLYKQGAAQTAGTAVAYNRAITAFDGKFTEKTPSTAYNYVIGNGTPRVRQLFGFTKFAPAGAPQTPTNP